MVSIRLIDIVVGLSIDSLDSQELAMGRGVGQG